MGHKNENTIIEIKNMNHFFGGLHAINNISFKVKKGTVKAIIGPNGAGKTTLFNLISGSFLPLSGSVIYKGRTITGARPYKTAEMGILRTFQNIKLCGHMTVLENVMIGRHIRSRSGFMSAILRLPGTLKEESDIKEKAFEILEFFSIKDLASYQISSLPFGKQRAVEFARAYAAEPELLLLDEPASGLNIYETQELAGIIKKINEEGITILLVEHDMSLIMDISDEIVVLNFGKHIAEGTPEEIQRNREVISIYLGEDDA